MITSRHHYVMGTVVSFLVATEEPEAGRLDEAIGDACDELDRLDAIFSTWREDSALSRLRRGELALGHAPPEIGDVLELCSLARQASAGLFDPWAMPGGVDPTGLVKGWAVERAAGILAAAGLAAGLVNGGGDIATFGEAEEPWRIGIQHPWRDDAIARLLEIHGGESIATSGRYQRGDHLVVPRGAARGRAGYVASASVRGPSLAMADALATALSVGGPGALDLLDSLGSYEGYRILADGSEEETAYFGLAAASLG